MSRRSKFDATGSASRIFGNGIQGWRPPSPRFARLEQLRQICGHHCEMCPCDLCVELRSL